MRWRKPLIFDIASGHQRFGFRAFDLLRRGRAVFRSGREFEEFPALTSYLMRRFPNPPKSQHGAPEAQADIKYRDLKPITEETEGLTASPTSCTPFRSGS